MDHVKSKIESIQPTKMISTVEKQEKLDDLKSWIKDSHHSEKHNTIDQKKLAEKERQKGNEQVKSSEYMEAIAHYRKAVEYNPGCHLSYANMGLALMKQKQWANALIELNKAVELDKTYLKAIARRAECFFELREWPQAVDDYEKCLEAEPNNKDFIDKLKRSREKMLASKDFQANEKRSMKKVQIQEDSSDGEDVDFGDAKSKTPQQPTPASTSTDMPNGSANSASGGSSGVKSNLTGGSANTKPINEKMTEDEQDLTYLTDMTTKQSVENGYSSSKINDNEQKLKDQEERVKNFISQ